MCRIRRRLLTSYVHPPLFSRISILRRPAVFDVLGQDVWEVKKANFDQTRVKHARLSSFWQIRVHLPVCFAVPGFSIFWLISWVRRRSSPALRETDPGSGTEHRDSSHLLPGQFAQKLASVMSGQEGLVRGVHQSRRAPGGLRKHPHVTPEENINSVWTQPSLTNVPQEL